MESKRSQYFLHSNVFFVISWFGHLAGCVPGQFLQIRQSRSGSADSADEGKKKKSGVGGKCSCLNSKVYSIIMILLVTFFTIEYLLSNSALIVATTSTAKWLLMVVSDYIFYTCDVGRRIYVLIKLPVLLGICWDTDANGSSSSVGLGVRSHGQTSLYFVFICISFLTALSRTILSQFYFLFPASDGPKKFRSVLFPFDPLRSHFGSLSLFWIEFSSLASKLPARALIWFLGQYYLEKYVELMGEFENYLQIREQVPKKLMPAYPPISSSNQIWTIPVKAALKSESFSPASFMQRFQRLQESFKVYNSFVGFLILVCAFESTTFVVYNTNNMSKNFETSNFWMTLTGLCGMIDHLSNLLLIAHTGQRFKTVMTRTKHQIKVQFTALAMDSKENGSLTTVHRLRTLCDGILTWEWKLSAAGLFNVDYRLIPAIASTVMTYVMFVYQLKISDMTSAYSSMNKTRGNVP